MDTIEKSNLSRQFLFRNSDIGQLKSEVAARQVQKMNNEMNIESQSLRVGPSTENVYNDEFFDSLSGIVTALDNVEARLYIDTKAVYYNKPMIDSGTLGTKGSVQVIIPPPINTESYASSRDPEEGSIPICTLKHFPNKIEHTIQWARDIFEGWFKIGPAEVNNYVTRQLEYLKELETQSNVQLSNLQLIYQYMVDERPKSYNDCLQWARLQFELEFNHKIRQLLFAFPIDAVTSEGAPFWSGPKRPPNPIEFDINDKAHKEFIISAAKLRAFIYQIKPTDDDKLIYQAIQTTKLPVFEASRKVKIATSDAEAKQMEESGANEFDNHDELVENVLSKLPSFDQLNKERDLLNVIEFEKDDPTNCHIAFMTSCSNLRARNYSIREVSDHETRFVAGKIVPAIATTTALVTGIVCLEIYKLLQLSNY